MPLKGNQWQRRTFLGGHVPKFEEGKVDLNLVKDGPYRFEAKERLRYLSAPAANTRTSSLRAVEPVSMAASAALPATPIPVTAAFSATRVVASTMLLVFRIERVAGWAASR